MCSPVRCGQCGKTTWAGCGQQHTGNIAVNSGAPEWWWERDAIDSRGPICKSRRERAADSGQPPHPFPLRQFLRGGHPPGVPDPYCRV